MSILSINPFHFSIENMFFLDRVKNVIMKNGEFIKFMYSDQDCIMNSLYFQVPLIFISKEKLFHKTQLLYNPLNPINITNIRQIYFIEKSILDYFSNNGKKPIFKISENLYNGNIQFTEPENNNKEIIKNGIFIIKFSGIWENSTEYGITYKFIFINNHITT